MKCRYCGKKIVGKEINPYSYPPHIVFCSIECYIRYEESGRVMEKTK